MLDHPNNIRITERRSAVRAEILSAAWEVARETGLATLTLRDVAQRVGMRAPSLYSYFASKHDIYDAMFGQAWGDYLAVARRDEAALPDDPREGLKALAHGFFDHAVADLARHQLMNQRTIPGFEPSPEAYRPAVEVLELARRNLARFDVTDPKDVDIFTALIGGFIDAQQANDPGGDRWARLLDTAIEMFADHARIPRSKSSTTPRSTT